MMRAFTNAVVLRLVLLPLVAHAFAPSLLTWQQQPCSLFLSSSSTTTTTTVVTGPQGQPASSYQEDVQLTLQIILDHVTRSTTVSKDQFLAQMAEQQQASDDENDQEHVDLSIPYDAAARLAYEEACSSSSSSDMSSMKFEDFQEQCIQESIALVKSKQPVNLRIPYHAAAQLAFMASDRKLPYDEFKKQYEIEAVELVKSKQQK